MAYRKKDEGIWYELLVTAIGIFLILFFKTCTIV